MTSVDKFSNASVQGGANAAVRWRSPSNAAPNPNGSLDAPSANTPTREVTLSGRGMLISRLFGENESTYTGEVQTNPKDKAYTGALIPFLTTQDRALLEEMYVYAAENGIDLKHVDALGGDLAGYRKHGRSAVHEGQYDLEGHQMTTELSTTNKVAAERIAVSDALNTTRLDAGFIQSELDAGGHAVNHAFLERMVEVFSIGGSSDQATSANRGPIAAYSAEANKLVVKLSADVRLVIPEADYANVDGVGRWRTPELAERHRLSQQSAAGSAVSSLLNGGNQDIQHLSGLLKGYGKLNNVPQETISQLIGLLDGPTMNRKPKI